ncbi:polysaccharide pyruvyl transferase family protein [Pseudobutyrivibrio xylanivorans]|uniref:Polysaccharide pyruvyl transferase n=1 Tax=Pseudobutyrivibrio xylanivorans DSM 14809 TaxID=1123012 RepID=A0A1M6I355_PSEXY|nr:polysaccharide pyruvyl transferase family protein [Pseudobutyrivibrio xylanivorans]SHJ28860.1 Polysaccharide pyruvyl transferase [Pseudobutyrivibrio xylanivorans DSM 14809]
MRKKEVRIVTIVDRNYGNRLQNLALTRVLEQLGCNVKTLPVQKLYKLKKMVKIVLNPILGKGNEWEKFETLIHYDRCIASEINTDKIDYFVAGSDQVWNPHFVFLSKREFLYFAKPEQRVSYAGSFGVTEYPEDKKKEYGEELKKFKAISVREKSAIDLVKEMSGRDAQFVLDPTLLLSADDWNREIKNKDQEGKPYVAVYFLGDMKNECVTKVLDECKKKGMGVKNILEMNKANDGGVGPFDFVSIIKNADYVLTDSFHATVFSLIYHRDFVVVNRSKDKWTGNMSTRLVSLLDMIGMQERFVATTDELEKINWNCDYSGVDSIIEAEKANSIDFLKNSLNI